MRKRQLVTSACLCLALATTSTSLLAQSGRIHNQRAAMNDLSRSEKQPSHSDAGATNTRAVIDSAPSATSKDESAKASRPEMKPTQAQRLTDEEVVSIIIVTALVLIVFVGLRKT